MERIQLKVFLSLFRGKNCKLIFEKETRINREKKICWDREREKTFIT